MTRSFVSAVAALGFSLVAVTGAQAGPITTLGECYNAVITWCNNTHPDHASSCANSRLDECDDQFGAAAAQTGLALQRANVVISPRAFERLMTGAEMVRRSR